MESMQTELNRARGRAYYHALERIHIEDDDLAAELALTNPDHARLRWIRRRVWGAEQSGSNRWQGFVNILGDVYQVFSPASDVPPKDWTLE